MRRVPRLFRLALLPLVLAPIARAGNGPETAPVPLPVVRDDLVPKNAFRLDVDAAFTQYDETSREEAQQKALEHGSFESFDHTLLGTLELEYGYEEDLTLGAALGYFFGADLLSAEREQPASVALSEADPDGLTDLWLTARYRFDREHDLSVIGGLELPVGEHQQSGSDGERLSPSSQPSDGAFGARLGLAWSTPRTEPLSVAASAVYTLHTEHEGASVGDRIDYGVALTYRASPRFEWLAEVSGAALQHDDTPAGEDPNTGGDVLFASAGLRWQMTERVAWSLTPALPLFADLDGEQAEARFRVTTGLSMSF
jgi:hypothetical protein